MLKIIGHAGLFTALTLLTQLGGVAWLLALFFKRRILTFFVAYAALWAAAMIIAPYFGRVPIGCGENDPLVVQSWVYCALNRNYVKPELGETLTDLAVAVEQEFPGTQTQVLDANFPFWAGFPLLPHLSHDDGKKADIAFYYRDHDGYVRGATRSPIGYFAFEQGPSECPDALVSLRWDLDILQRFWLDLRLEQERTRFALNWLAQDSRISRLFIEPHLQNALGLTDEKIRFQGCRAARHDDHIHLEL